MEEKLYFKLHESRRNINRCRKLTMIRINEKKKWNKEIRRVFFPYFHQHFWRIEDKE